MSTKLPLPPEWRKIGVMNETDGYIEGVVKENGFENYRRFLKSEILDGKIFRKEI